MSRMPRSFRVLRHRDLRLVIGANVVSQIGMWAQYVGVGWAANELSDSELAVGLAFAAQWSASLFLSPVAGVLADRFDRRHIVLAGNVAMAIPPIILGFMLHADAATVPWLIALVFLGGVAQAFTQPATLALVPRLVPVEDVQQAVALNSGLMNFTRIIGPGIGGFVIKVWGIGWAFHVNAATYAAVLLAWLFVRADTRAPVAVGPSEPFFARLRAGVVYARANPIIGRLLVLTAVVLLFLMHAPLLPVFTEEVLDGDESTYAFLASAPGIGAFAAALIAGELTSVRTQRRTIAVSAVATGALLFVFAMSRNIVLSAAVLCVFGLVQFLVNTLTTTTVMLESSDEMRGRVMGLLGMANVGLLPLNSVLAGLCAAWLGPVATVAGAGLCLLAFTTWFVISRQLATTLDVPRARPAPVLDLTDQSPAPATDPSPA